jgi:1-acyl-sn-glycerol-3-phosphate acyltransferase
VGRFKGGIFLLAIDSGVPVLPISIAGSRFVMRKGQLMVCPEGVAVSVHPPMTTAGITRDQAREFAERVREVVCSGLSDDDPQRAGTDGAGPAL